jgi:small subunit ribosomal protein S6
MEKIISSYECMFIINCASGDDAAKATVEKFTSTITANAEIVETAEWGRRRLAYPIDDMNEGYYVVFTFKSEGAFPAELQRLANIDETVMRCMVIKLEYDAAEAATKKAAAAQAAALAAEAAAKAAAEAAAAEAAETEAAEPAVDAE